MAEIIDELQPSDTVLAAWLWMSRNTIVNPEGARDCAKTICPNMETEEDIRALMATESKIREIDSDE